jgi:hypothetical protein
VPECFQRSYVFGVNRLLAALAVRRIQPEEVIPTQSLSILKNETVCVKKTANLLMKSFFTKCFPTLSAAKMIDMKLLAESSDAALEIEVD